MATMTKKQIRKQRLERHYATLEKLSAFLGKQQDGKKLSLKLWKIERLAHGWATDYCNGKSTPDEWDRQKEAICMALDKAFEYVDVPGFFVNGDPRGHALKIMDDIEREYYRPAGIELERDWGGYGILSPEIE